MGTGFHPELTGRENVFLNGAILGMRGSEIRAKFDDIVAFAEVERFIDTPVRRFSSGMYVRLAFAVAAFLEPEILFIDEVVSVGDQAFSSDASGAWESSPTAVERFSSSASDLASVSALCSRAVLIDGGRLVMDGEVDAVIDHYLSSIQPSTGASLEQREDRTGDGRMRARRVEVFGPNGGSVRTGEPCTFRLDYAASSPFADVVANIVVEGPLGEPLFVCSNEVSGDELQASDDRGAFVCSIPAMPLLAGRYSVITYLRANGVAADTVRNAAYFDVFESDVFGTGRLPDSHYGRFVIDHSWSVEAKLGEGQARVVG